MPLCALAWIRRNFNGQNKEAETSGFRKKALRHPSGLQSEKMPIRSQFLEPISSPQSDHGLKPD